MRPPDLADLDAFTAIARARSFRGAAILRGVSASGLSEAVRRLEARLSVRLLNRTTRSVTPTEAGLRLLDQLEPALAGVQTALDGIGGNIERPAGTLRLNVPVIVARAVLPPIIGPFLLAHPGVNLELVADNSFIDVLAAGFDAGIRYEERLDQDMIAVPIGPRIQRYATAASAAYLRTHGRPEHPRDLLGHACIRHRFESGVASVWEFERDGTTLRIIPAGPLISNVMEVQIAAAVAGLGIVSGFEDDLVPALASGALEPVLRQWWQSFSGPFLYYQSRTHMPAPLRAFVDFIKEKAGST